VIARLLPYVTAVLTKGCRLHHVTRHILGLFQGVRGARAWRRYLSEHSHHDDAGIAVIEQALAMTDSHSDPASAE
jgi:tRNA-dihydrouridine synthase A